MSTSVRSVPTPWARLGWSLAVLLAACGEVQVEEPILPDTVTAQDIAGTDASTPPDTTTTDTVQAGQCKSNADCLTMKGKTPCNIPTCDQAKGVCTLKLRGVDEPCDVALLELTGVIPTECQLALCDAGGQCQIKNKKDGDKCGVGVCGKKCATGQCVATSPADYDDKNPCTNDYCDQGNKIVHEPISSAEVDCSDNDSCTQDDLCVAGVCKGAAKSCDDQIPCTTDSCDKTDGCQHVPVNTQCDDGNPCTKNACDLSVGCTVTGNDPIGKCDDGNSCTANDKCLDKQCKGQSDPALPGCGCSTDADCSGKNTPCGGKYKCGLKKACELDETTVVKCPASDNACKVSQCEPTTGACQLVPVTTGKVCDDGNACTKASQCVTGVCSGQPDVVCDDKNPCTNDECDPAKGCTFVPNASACDDGNKCTGGDICNGGVCTGAKVSCDDNIPCTFDSCDAGTGKCTSTPDAKLCDDGNPCTSDSCDGAKGCQNVANDSAACSDNNECTTDKCVAGKCQSTNTCQCQVAADCDDKNVCTTDACQAGKCVYSNASDTTKCDVGDKCMQPGTGTCSAGVCKGGTPVDCKNLAGPCTVAACNAQTGQCEASSKPDGSPCDADSSGCTVNDACKLGKCNPGPAPTCAATDECLLAQCKSLSATTFECAKVPATKGKTCNDDQFCTVSDACDGAGKCVGQANPCTGPTTPGEPGNFAGQQCMVPACDEATDSCNVKPAPTGTACDDGKFCTTGDKCNDTGSCVAGTPLVCKAPGACQQNVCDDVAKACVSKPIYGCCLSNAECDDGKPCSADTCNASTSQCSWAPMKTCCQPLLWSATFEDGKPHGLMFENQFGPASGWQVWPNAGTQAKSPPGALYYGNLTTKTFNFLNQANHGFATTPPMFVPAGKPMKLTLNVFLGTEGGNVYDILTIYAKDPSGKLIEPPIWKKDQTNAPINQWFPLDLDLAKFAGLSINLVFKFETTDGAVNDTLGVVLDDIVVTSTCP